MSWGFERGRVYNRREAIHARFGGQQQGGIITPQRHSVVIIVTGEIGQAHGYHDRQRPDGVFEYFGEGQVGDMQMMRGNAAIANHSANGKSLLLFQKTPAGLRFVDEMIYEAHHWENAPDTQGNQRQAIVFELRSSESVTEATELAEPAIALDLAELRRRAFAAARPEPLRRLAIGSVFERSRDVRDYVVARAGGACEGCQQPAPFNRVNGSPYLEPHHTTRLSDGGPDDPRLVIALCPNCHRRVHFGADGEQYNSDLIERLPRLEGD